MQIAKSASPRWDFLALWALLALSQLRVLSRDFFPSHDTLANLWFFVQMGNNYFQTGEHLRWLPYGFNGVPSAFYENGIFTPFQYLVLPLAKAVGATSLPKIFYFSVFLEQSAFLFGCYLLGKDVLKNRWSLWFLCLGCIGTIFWEIQLQFNFRLYYLLPYFLLFFRRFFLTGQWSRLWLAGIFLLVSLLGDVAYAAGFYVFFALMAASAFAFAYGIPRGLRPDKVIQRSSLVPLGGLASLALVYGMCARHTFDHTVRYVIGRGADLSLGSVERWASDGSAGLRRYLELFYAVPFDAHLDVTIFFGIVPIALLLIKLPRTWGKEFRAFGILALAVFAFSLSYLTPVGPLSYLLPLVSFFRHLGFVATVNKFILLLLAALALDELATSPNSARSSGRRAWAVCLGLALLLLQLDMLVLRGALPYPVHGAFRSTTIPITELHYFLLLVLGTLGFLLWKFRDKPALLPPLVVGLFLLEIGSYSSFLHFTAPLQRGALPEGMYKAQAWQFHPQRQSDRQGPAAQLALAFSQRIGSMEALVDGSLQLDSCVQPYRRNFVTESFDYLLRARHGLPLTGELPTYPAGLAERWPARLASPWSASPFLPLQDNQLARAAGCGSPKLLLTQNVTPLASLGEAANFVKQRQNIDEQIGVEISPRDPLRTLLSPTSPGILPLDETSVKDFQANGLTVNLTAPRRGVHWLVYRESYHPDWEAFVDGQPRPVYRANLGFMAVPVDEKETTVEWNFTGGAFERWQRALRFLAIFFAVVLLGSILVYASGVTLPKSWLPPSPRQ